MCKNIFKSVEGYRDGVPNSTELKQEIQNCNTKKTTMQNCHAFSFSTLGISHKIIAIMWPASPVFRACQNPTLMLLVVLDWLGDPESKFHAQAHGIDRCYAYSF